MSNWTNAQIPPVLTAKDIFNRNGLKGSHIAEGKNTISSLLRRAETDDAYAKAQKSIGDGVISMKYYKGSDTSDGNVITDSFIGDDGRIVQPDSDGVVRLHDYGYYDMLSKMQAEYEAVIDEQLEKCMVSNYVCERLLGKTLYDKLAPTRGTDLQIDGTNMSDELAKSDARPSMIKALPCDSIAQTNAIAKLRIAVMNARINWTGKDTGTGLKHTQREADK